jgi:hypothetical protein
MQIKHDGISRNKRINQTQLVQRVEWFNCSDKKGRVLGADVMTGECDYIALTAAEMVGPYYSYSSYPAGHYFYFCPQALRGGKDYGPCQPVYYFTTAESRDAAVAEYLKQAARRALKKAAK